MRKVALSIIGLLVLGFAAAVYFDFPSARKSSTPAPRSETKAKPAKLALIPITASGELAPPGVFYLLTGASIETKGGITGLRPGTKLTLVKPGIYMSPAGKLSLSEAQVTNDLGKLQCVVTNERISQEIVRVNAQAELQAQARQQEQAVARAKARFATKYVNLQTDRSGVRTVPVQLNGVMTRDFIVDSGASGVAIPSGAIEELKRNGSLAESDFLGHGTSVIADGTKIKTRHFILRSVTVGETTVANVEGVETGLNGSYLLGMDFLTKAKAVYDTANGRLIFNPQ